MPYPKGADDPGLPKNVKDLESKQLRAGWIEAYEAAMEYARVAKRKNPDAYAIKTANAWLKNAQAEAEARGWSDADDAAEIIPILDDQRRIEVVGRHHVLLDLGRQRPLAIERATGRHAHHEEGDGDDHQQRRHGGHQPAQDVGAHDAKPAIPPVAGTATASAATARGKITARR